MQEGTRVTRGPLSVFSARPFLRAWSKDMERGRFFILVSFRSSTAGERKKDMDEKPNPPTPPRPEPDVERIIQAVAKASDAGKLLLFVGTGFSRAVLNWKNTPATQVPGWLDLLETICKRERVNADDLFCRHQKHFVYDCPAIASKMAEAIQGSAWADKLSKLKQEAASETCWLPTKRQCAHIGEIIRGLRPVAIVTTNYDEVMEALLGNGGKHVSRRTHFQIAPKGRIPIWHVHGSVRDAKDIVLTREDYLEFFRPGNEEQQRLAKLLEDYVTVFVGYSLSDLNLLAALDWATNLRSFPACGKSNSPRPVQIGNGNSVCFAQNGSLSIRQIVIAYDETAIVSKGGLDTQHADCRWLKTNDVIETLERILNKAERLREDSGKAPLQTRSACQTLPRSSKSNREWINRFLNEETRDELLRSLASTWSSSSQTRFLSRESISIIETLERAYGELKRKTSQRVSERINKPKKSPAHLLCALLQIAARMPIEQFPVSCKVNFFHELELRANQWPSNEGTQSLLSRLINKTEKPRLSWMHDVASYLGNRKTIEMLG